VTVEELYVQIIKDSAKKLRDVKMLSNFFNHKDLFAVYIRTKVIHNLFESNRSLDINKLELFHVQYTSSLIELFQKLKKSKEQQYLLINDEIYINDDLIKKLEKETEGDNFQSSARKHGVIMANKLKEIYAMLDSGNISPSFGWGDIMVFSVQKGREFFRELPGGEVFLQLTDSDGKKTYQAEYAVIEKKLIGKLNKLNFRVKFTCGLRFENEYVEVFDFIDSNEQFIFINSIKTFYLLDEKMANGLDLSKNSSDKEAIIFELKSKNDLLRDKLSTIKTVLPQTVEEVLEGYLTKISGVDFLEELQNVDEQTNILRAMLNININTK
jgi:hypothetical protein